MRTQPAPSSVALQRFAFSAMASACEVVLAPEATQDGAAQAAAAIDEVRRIEIKYSRYRPDSIVSRINAAAGADWISCDAETWSLLEFADTLYRGSAGLFDLTAGVLRRQWDFKNARLPTEHALAEVCALIGWPAVEREALPAGQGGRIRLPKPGMEIDFGGFGKEYAADRAGHLLTTLGARHGYVNLGGDMRVIGPKPDGAPWMMGIRDPRAADRVVATIPVLAGGLATSGDYERFFELDGRRYCHVMDPRSGWPVQHWQTVSVCAPLAIVAGNCATVAMLKGASGLDFLAASGFSFLAIGHAGEIHMRSADTINAVTLAQE